MQLGPESYIFERQLAWALRRGITLIGSAGVRGRLAYTSTLDENLFEPLSIEARREYSSGDGGELGRQGEAPGKMQAIHSSSALGCNAFHYWRRVGKPEVIARACGLMTKGKASIAFEQKLPIDSRVSKYAPNLDVVLRIEEGQPSIVGIECKFGEPFSSRERPPLSAKYLGDELFDLWRPMPALLALAKTCASRTDGFVHLDPAQLLKHLLGLTKTTGSGRFQLVYLFYDVPGPDGAIHAEEARRFSEIATADGVAVIPVTYQSVISRLAADRNEHAGFVDYMTERYF